MCGIVGYVGKAQAAPILLDGLSKLEYRGYDSAGIPSTTYRGEELPEIELTPRTITIGVEPGIPDELEIETPVTRP